jgi:hypothetical protein
VVSLQGFKNVAIQGVHLEVGQKARIDAKLPTGEIREFI